MSPVLTFPCFRRGQDTLLSTPEANTCVSLSDSFARAGYLAVAPDMFNNDPAPADLATPGFNATAWTLLHSPPAVDPIIAKAVAYLNSRGIDKIATAGYCYGGRYAFRLLAADKGVDAGFAAHPSLLENSEILAITKPISVAAAGTSCPSLLLVAVYMLTHAPQRSTP